MADFNAYEFTIRATNRGERRVNTRHLLIFGLYLCAVPAVSGDSKPEQAQVLFRRPGLGAGGGGSLGIVTIRSDDDKKVNTCAIVQAVSALPAGFLVVPPANGLEARQRYKTDYSRLSQPVLSEYNRQNTDVPLPAGPIYGVVYEISYDVQTGRIVYEVKSTLNYTGSRSDNWYEYKKNYNDTFFAKKLLAGIVEEVKSCAKPN
jgi:hypothetical protein